MNKHLKILQKSFHNFKKSITIIVLRADGVQVMKLMILLVVMALIQSC